MPQHSFKIPRTVPLRLALYFVPDCAQADDLLFGGSETWEDEVRRRVSRIPDAFAVAVSEYLGNAGVRPEKIEASLAVQYSQGPGISELLERTLSGASVFGVPLSLTLPCSYGGPTLNGAGTFAGTCSLRLSVPEAPADPKTLAALACVASVVERAFSQDRTVKPGACRCKVGTPEGVFGRFGAVGFKKDGLEALDEALGGDRGALAATLREMKRIRPGMSASVPGRILGVGALAKDPEELDRILGGKR